MEREEAIRENLLVKLEAKNGAADSSVTAVLLFSILIASCGSLINGCGLGYTAPVQSQLMSDLNLSTEQFSLFGSLATAGALLGSLMSGNITEYLGRRKTMGIAAICSLFGWIAIAFSEAVWSLYIGRLLVGAEMGLVSYVVPMYTAEITPKNLRGGAVLTFVLGISCGISLMFFLGLVVSWRVLALISTIPCIVQIIALPFIPDSPRWLMKVGLEKEYVASLQRLRGDNVDISLEAAEIKVYTEALKNMHESNFLALFQRKYAYALTVRAKFHIGLGLMALGQFSGYPFATGFSTAVGTISIAIIQIFFLPLLSSLADEFDIIFQIPVTSVGVILMDKVGRRPLILISASGMCLGCILSGLSFLFKDHGWLTSINPSLAFVGILLQLLVAAYPMGLGGIPFIIMSEIFPMNVKGTAGSLATCVNWATSWIVSYAFNFMLDWSSAGTFFLFAFVNALTCLFVFKLVPETKGQNHMKKPSVEEGAPLLLSDGSAAGAGDGDGVDGSYAATTVVVRSTLVAVCGSFVFGAAVGYSSPTESGIIADLDLTLAEYSVFGSIMTIGAMIGAIFSGRIADLFGRRGTMAFSQLSCLMGWIAITFSEVAWLLDAGRLSIGLGIGLLSYAVPVYIAEITPKNLRGGFGTVHQLMICCGVSLMYLIGTFVQWRILALLGAIPCLLQLLGLFFIPESPRWLAKNARWQDCDEALRHLRGPKSDISFEATEIREYTETPQQLSEAKFTDLFQRRYAHSLVVGVGLMVLQQFGGVNGVAFYATSIFESAGRIGTIAMVVVQIPMTALGSVLMDKSGRRPLLMISAAGTCLGCFLAALAFFLQDLNTWSAITPFMASIGVLIYTGSFSLGMGGIPWVIMSEVFPINVKGSAGSLVTLVSWLGSWIVSYTFNFLMTWSSAGTFFTFSIICGFTVGFVVKLVPETKGRTLEEIQASMNSNSSG
ncbi:hypothetical protein V2J09_008114 [Rumex salicifolius]